MSRAAARPSTTEPDLLRLAAETEDAVGSLLADVAQAIQARVSSSGKISTELLEREQHAVHGLAWLATYVEVVRQLAAFR
jgi:(2S)-methylsuccinyl-CoA dehydrogenase